MSILSSRLNFNRLIISFSAEEVTELPSFTGSTLRGVFGKALKKSYCVVHHGNCDECMLKDSCGYFEIFESTNSSAELKSRGMEKRPHPFLLIPPVKTLYNKNEVLHFQISLLGNQMRHLPYILFSFQKMGEFGFGVERKKFIFLEVKDYFSGKLIWKDGKIDLKGISNIELGKDRLSGSDSDLYLSFRSPVKLIRSGRVIQKPNSLDFQNAIYRRYSHLFTLFGTFDPRDLEELRKIEFNEIYSEHKKWKRYSNRQKRSIEMQGVEGSYKVKTSGLKNYNVLQIMKYLNLGKATTFGLGRFRLKDIIVSN
ncbi:MAG: CRISPR system precrRNA processing endoribonuclease RAMP protein Cas6 [Leptospiraceae bacterium]|nr:CRISPR system precrRNA processing endoribonuclease RAMP protein Cas6 [Leptospiraceae bacterium]